MVLWIGVDDTDSLRGMCTTFLATEFVRELTKDLDLIGYPRLVRLNPNIPWKTRGNGAIAMAVGEGRGNAVTVGEIEGRKIHAYFRGQDRGDPKEILARLGVLVERWSDLENRGTDPGLVVLHHKPVPSLYWRAVRGIVALRDARRAIRGKGLTRSWKSGRGLIGASAACAWRPHDRTWEVLAYRDRSKWGAPRSIDAASVRRMDRLFPSTFNNYDYDNDRVVIAPRTPCPVLLGIRGERPEDLPASLRVIRGESPDRWLVFLTNQGTDDHVRPCWTGVPRSAGRYSGSVTREPHSISGGHVVFRIRDMDVTVYEPAKQLRAVVRGLAIGDRVEVIGSVRDYPRTINLEKLNVLTLADVTQKVSNPTCPRCGGRTKSMGRGAPFRCRRCGLRAERSSAILRPAPRSIRTGWYEPPTGSRRHLNKPLKRLMDSRARPNN